MKRIGGFLLMLLAMLTMMSIAAAEETWVTIAIQEIAADESRIEDTTITSSSVEYQEGEFKAIPHNVHIR